MRILMAWEMGNNYGHVTKLAELAKAIAKKQKKNAEIFFALQNPGALQPFAEGLDYTLLQAPYSAPRPSRAARPQPQQPKRKGAPPPPPRKSPVLSYADDLRPCGYEDPQTLAGLVRAWRDLYALVKPDVIITQAAPTALIAARGLKIRTIAFGGGYDVPVKTVPMPLTRAEFKIAPAEFMAREKQVLDTVNKALEANGLKPAPSLAEALRADEEYLTVFEELDHYQGRAEMEGRPVTYMGQFYTLDNGEDLAWNKKAAKRILAYIRPEGAGFAQAMVAFGKLPIDYDIIVAAPGLPREALGGYNARPNIRVLNGPVRLGPLLKDCDLGVCHASQGISCAFAVHGIPQLLLPGHVEQLMFAKAVGRNGLGLGVVGRYGPEKLLQLVNTLLSNPVYNEKAREFAKKYKDFKPENLAERIASSVIEGVTGKGAGKAAAKKK